MTKTDERKLTITPVELKRLVAPLRRPGFLGPVSRRTQALLAAVLLLIAGAAVARLLDTAEEPLPDGAVFRLDDTVFTEQQLDQRAALVEFLYGVTKPDTDAKIDEFNRALAKAVAVSLIVEDAAESHEVVIADKVASDKLARMIVESGLSRRTFIQQLGSFGLSEQDILGEIKFQEANEQLFAQITEDVKPTTDAAAKEYFDSHSAEMATPEYRTLANIVVSSKEEAREVTRLARSGREFSALVTKYSIDQSTRGKGGDLGTVEASQLQDGYAAAAFTAGRGEIFGPVQTTQGWNVGRVIDIQQPTPLDFPSIKDALKARLTYNARLEEWNAFLADLVEAADITYAPDYKPTNPDELPAQSPGAGTSSLDR